MPRVHHVKKARKDNPRGGIKKGESYYWWAFKLPRGGYKVYSKTRPKRSQLTRSDFYGKMYDLEDDILGDIVRRLRAGELSGQEAADEVTALAEEVRSAGEEEADKANNIEQGLDSTKELLEGRGEKCEEIASELEAAASEVEELEWPDEPEEPEEPEPEGTDCDDLEEEEKQACQDLAVEWEEYNLERTDYEEKMAEVGEEAAGVLEGVDWSVE